MLKVYLVGQILLQVYVFISGLVEQISQFALGAVLHLVSQGRGTIVITAGWCIVIHAAPRKLASKRSMNLFPCKSIFLLGHCDILMFFSKETYTQRNLVSFI